MKTEPKDPLLYADSWVKAAFDKIASGGSFEFVGTLRTCQAARFRWYRFRLAWIKSRPVEEETPEANYIKSSYATIVGTADKATLHVGQMDGLLGFNTEYANNALREIEQAAIAQMESMNFTPGNALAELEKAGK